MVKLLVGTKGSGKTKKLIEICNEATKTSKGNVVFIEKEGILIHDVHTKARLVVVDEYGIKSHDDFYGFIAGMCAGNYDITDIIIDSTFKIVGRDFEKFSAFVKRLESLNTEIVLSVSATADELPAEIPENAIIEN